MNFLFNLANQSYTVTITPQSSILNFLQNEVINCQILPMPPIDFNKIQFFLTNIKPEYYTRNNHTIEIIPNSSLVNIEICAVCANLAYMNATQCYTLLRKYILFHFIYNIYNLFRLRCKSLFNYLRSLAATK